MDEIWKDIPSWVRLYQASSHGRIRSLVNIHHMKRGTTSYTRTYGGKILSQKIGYGGYLCVNLWKNNKGHMNLVHRLVCETFNPIFNHKQLVTNHKDGNRTNNQYTNLEFVTQMENLLDAEKRNGIASWTCALNQRKANWRNALSKT